VDGTIIRACADEYQRHQRAIVQQTHCDLLRNARLERIVLKPFQKSFRPRLANNLTVGAAKDQLIRQMCFKEPACRLALLFLSRLGTLLGIRNLPPTRLFQWLQNN